MIPAVLLTAGLATRLRPLSTVRAKAALPVGGQSLAERLLRRLGAAGVTDAVLNLHHLPESITSRIGDGSHIGMHIRYSWESPEVLGSAGGPRKAMDLLDSPTFLLVNGDTLTDADVNSLVRAHQASDALVTIAVIPNTMPERYSGLAVDADGVYAGVVPRGSTLPSFHVIGLQVAEKAAFDSLPAGIPASTIGGPQAHYSALVATRPGSVRLHHCPSSFLDIGTPEDYVATCRSLAPPDATFVERGVRVHVHADAHVHNAIVWDDVEIGEGAQLNGTVVTDGVRVPASSQWNNVILRRVDGGCGPNEHQVGELIVTPVGRV